MTAARFIFELIILVVGSLGWGLAILRRFKLPPLERLCLVVGLSWFVVYLAATGIYLAHRSGKWEFGLSGISLILLGLCFGDLKKLWHSRQVRQTIWGFGLLLAWNLLMLSLIRNYSGGLWSGDWYEHYQRSLFFAEYLPKETKFLEIYDLPARPPMMNILCAHVLAQAGERFDLFQVAAAFFNLLIYFPCALLAGALARRGRRQLPLLVVLFAASPLLVENVTYTWTKLFPGLYILLGTWLYLRGFQKQDAFRIVAAFASLCVGMLIHYSAGPYLLFFALHYAWIWRGRKWKWVEPLAIAGVCVLILASWLGWSAWFYGWHTTVSSNTTVMGSESLSFGGNLQKIATNIISTLIPHPLHVSRNDFDKALYQPNAMGYLRDYWFLVYQPTVPEGIGLVGGLTVVYLLVRKLCARALSLDQRIFWAAFIVVCTLVGIAAHGEASDTGVGHICLLPLSMLGVTFLAANFPSLSLWLRAATAVSVAFDFCFGIFLHIRVENLYFQPQFAGTTQLLPLNDLLLSRPAISNFALRFQEHLPYLGDHFQAVSGWLQVAMVLLMALLLYPLAQALRGTRRGAGGFYCALLVVLAGGALYCAKDEFDGADLRAMRQLDASADELKARAARASLAVDAAPESSRTQLELGEALYRIGDQVSATDHIAEAFALDLGNQRARYDILLMYYNGSPLSQDSYTTMTVAERVIQDAQSAAARRDLGIDLLNHRHYSQAIDQLTLAVQLSSGASAEPLMLLGIAHQLIGGPSHIDQSIAYLTQAIHLQPDSSEIDSALRSSLRLRGDSDADIDAFVQRARSGQ